MRCCCAWIALAHVAVASAATGDGSSFERLVGRAILDPAHGTAAAGKASASTEQWRRNFVSILRGADTALETAYYGELRTLGKLALLPRLRDVLRDLHAAPRDKRRLDRALEVLETHGFLAGDDHATWLFLFARASWAPTVMDAVKMAQVLLLVHARGAALPVRPGATMPAADAATALSVMGVPDDALALPYLEVPADAALPQGRGGAPAEHVYAVHVLSIALAHDLWAWTAGLGAALGAPRKTPGTPAAVTCARLGAFGAARSRVRDACNPGDDAPRLCDGDVFGVECACRALVRRIVDCPGMSGDVQ